jgi:molybdenum cofactor biosynthesis protein B
VLTISDGVHHGAREDLSGAVLAARAAASGHEVVWRGVLPDERDQIAERLAQLCDEDAADVVLSTGGTGFAPRDVTPEAVKPLCRREMDGFAVLFHQASRGTVGLSTLQSRAFAGQIGDMFIFCLPGSTGACRDGWDLVLRDELDSRYRPCSLAGLVPRLSELVPS